MKPDLLADGRAKLLPAELFSLLAGAAHGHQRFENFRHVGGLGTFELSGQFGGGGGAVAVQRGFDGLHALGHFSRFHNLLFCSVADSFNDTTILSGAFLPDGEFVG
jgi:hypothetical protein